MAREMRFDDLMEVAGISISNPDRLAYPDIGARKVDVARYYERVAEWMLPHVKGRPLTLVHCPEGITGSCNFLKHSKLWGPKQLRRIRIPEKKKIGEYMIADTLPAIVAIAQMSVLEIHTWNSTDRLIEKPDRIVIDLDPGDEVTWPEVISAARLVRRALTVLDLDSFVKTTGGRGLHVVVPLTPRADWSECLAFARGLSEMIERTHPESFTTRFAKAGRTKKILLDYLRNNRTNTSIAAYSTRARPGAPVSTPITWSELKPSLDPSSFTIETVPQKLSRKRADPWKDYWNAKQQLTRAMVKAVTT